MVGSSDPHHLVLKKPLKNLQTKKKTKITTTFHSVKKSLNAD
jgi:hypothetical protein